MKILTQHANPSYTYCYKVLSYPNGIDFSTVYRVLYCIVVVFLVFARNLKGT